MTFSHFSVRKRLYLGFGLILAVLLVVTLLGMSKVHTINTALRANSEQHAVIQRHAINFRGSAHDRSIAIRDVVLSANAADRRKELATIERLAGFYAKSAGPLEAMIAAPGASAQLAPLYAAIKDIETRTVATTLKIIELVERNDMPAANTVLWTEAKPQYEQWLAAINKLIDFEEARIQAANTEALQQAGGFVTVMLGSLGLALVIGGVLAWLISRSILQQLGAEPIVLASAARQVAAGDLSPVAGADQAPKESVMASLASMRESLAQLVGSVRNASDSIAVGSEHIAAGNQDLSRRTESQASNLQQTAASMQQLSQTVQANADTALQATTMAGTAAQAAEKGGEVVSHVVATMHDIAAASSKIADIIGVIDGIAFQTNILALNAAVEAARAGEQGRGFAVVASEVRTLAKRSADAAREIKTLIGNSMEKVENGTRLVGDAGQAMEGIVGQVKRVSDLIGRISTASLEQKEGIGQVGAAVNQLDDVTQQNAALVEESAAASESLRQQAAELAQTVSVFKLQAA